MRYIVSEPEFKLYQEGFAGKDTLGREEKGKQLSKLVENIDDPLVIALDGPWGSGKSFFLKCWVGAHSLENTGRAQTVYFDAFANDYLDDPLLALTRVIRERFEASDEEQGKLSKAKELGKNLWKPAARIVLAVGTSGVSEAVGAIGDAAIASAGKEAEHAIENLWKQETGRRQAMEEFRSALIALTQPDDETVVPRKLIIAIDELDRCRPDYALSVLEVIKHFFNVPNVHFVLGVNLAELGKSVQARYGQNVDANSYLQKFISFQFMLGNKQKNYAHNDEIRYFVQIAKSAELSSDMIDDTVKYLLNPSFCSKVSLRALERIVGNLSRLHNEINGYDHYEYRYRIVFSGMSIISVIDYPLYLKILSDDFNTGDISAFISAGNQDGDAAKGIHNLMEGWWGFLEPREGGKKINDSRIVKGYRRQFQRLIEDYFSK